MRVELDYRKPQDSDNPKGYIRLYPERNEEWGTMESLLNIFTGECKLLKVVQWESTHYVVKLNYNSLRPTKTEDECCE